MTDSVFFIPTLNELKSVFGTLEISRIEGIECAIYNDVKIFVTGVGKSNSAISSTIILSKLNVKKAILIGICGAYRNSRLSVGDIISVDKDYFVDEAKLYPDGRIKTLAECGFEPYKGNCASFSILDGFNAVSSNTVSLIPQTDELSNTYQSKTGAAIENMEGAPFGVASAHLGIEAFQLRGVSNYCGANQEWDIKLASKNLHAAADKIIYDLKAPIREK